MKDYIKRIVNSYDLKELDMIYLELFGKTHKIKEIVKLGRELNEAKVFLKDLIEKRREFVKEDSYFKLYLEDYNE